MMGDAADTALASAAATLGRLPPGCEQNVRDLVANAVYGIIYHGLTGEIGPAGRRRAASDYIILANVAANWTQALADEATARITPQGISVALTLVLATKLMWWMSNHHIGQGGFYAYMLKVVNAMIPTLLDADKMTYTHAIGHWASTHRVLNMLHIRNDVPFTPLRAPGADARVRITDDIRLRVTAMPAGTARHVLSHAILQKHGQHRVLMFSNMLHECLFVRDEVEAIVNAGRNNVALSIAQDPAVLDQDPRIVYHMGATYLTNGNEVPGA
jgi:hypothetical protein